MYLVCSQCHIHIDLPVWPTYELLHVLHFSLDMQLEFFFLYVWYFIQKLVVYSVVLLLILQSFDWIAAFHLELLQAKYMVLVV
jgi:hypothetical protein